MSRAGSHPQVANATTAVPPADTGDLYHHHHLAYSPGAAAGLAVLLGAFALLTVACNASALAAFARDRRLRAHVQNVYIANLAVADFLVGLFVIPLSLVDQIHSVYPLSYAVCKLHLILDWVVCYESVFAMVLISWDRYTMVKCGATYLYQQTSRKAVVWCAASWLLSLAVFGLPLAIWDHAQGYTEVEEGVCDSDAIFSLPYTVFILALVFFLPFALFAFFNLHIFRFIRQRAAGLPGTSAAFDHHQGAVDLSVEAGELRAKKQAALAKERQAAKSLAILVAVFILAGRPTRCCPWLWPLVRTASVMSCTTSPSGWPTSTRWSTRLFTRSPTAYIWKTTSRSGHAGEATAKCSKDLPHILQILLVLHLSETKRLTSNVFRMQQAFDHDQSMHQYRKLLNE